MANRMFGVPHHVARLVMATVSLTALLGMFVDAAPATEPSAAAATPASRDDSGCLRPLSDIIWGFLVTLLACAVAVWGIEKYNWSDTEDQVVVLSVAVFTPLLGFGDFIARSLQSAVLIWRYNKLSRNLSRPLPILDWYGHLKMLWSWVSPFSKSQGRILFCCQTVVNVPKESPLLQEEWLWEGISVVDLSEAMVIGEVADGKTQNGHYKRKELSFGGKTTFLLAEVVPKYAELKFLRGNSGFAMIALAIQALGYIYAILFRMVKNLPVSPLEVVGLILNIILLIQVSVFSIFNPCHRPLVIYLNSRQEKKLLEKMVHVKDRVSPRDWMHMWSYIVLGAILMCLGGIVVYFIVSLSKVSNIFVILPLIVFGVASIICTIGYALVDHRTLKFCVLLSIVAYIWAFVVTIVYWKSQHFNARAELLSVSQLIPFIG